MTSILSNNKQPKREGGQALVEFALSLPILLLFIMGLIDFSIVLFSYSQAQSSLRSALRYAQLIGYNDSGDPRPYLNCPELRDRASESFFAATHNVDIEYIKADGSGGPYDCSTVTDDNLANGDILHMELHAGINPFFLPLDEITLDFEGRRSIIKMITVAFDPDAVPPDPPAQPTNFRAISDGMAAGGECTTGEVEFYWDQMNPRPTKVEIHKASTETLLKTIDPAWNAYCIDDCDSINPMLGYRCYYAVAYTNSIAGDRSDTACAYCITEPSNPVSFTATADCTTGQVSFDWEWGDVDPPTRAEIRRDDTDAVVAEITADLFETECIDCDDINPLPNSRSYYMVAINAIGTEQRTSVPSNLDTAVCEPEETPGTVTAYLLQTSDGTCTSYGSPLVDEPVTLRYPDGVTTATFYTDSNGRASFAGMPPDVYELEVPLSAGGLGWATTDDGSACMGTITPLTIDMTSGAPVQYTFGYLP